MTRLAIRSIAACLLLPALLRTAVSAEDTPWIEEAHPYRIVLKLDRAVSDPAVVDLSAEAIVERVAKSAVDQVDAETLAFERAVLVNPKTGKQIGQFKLVRSGAPLDVDGSFTRLQAGEPPWIGFAPNKMKFEQKSLGGETCTALMIEEEALTNSKLQQSVSLQPGECYLLEYWFMMNARDNEMGVMIYDPKHRLFAQVRHSYVNRMPPPGKWVRQRVIFRPEVPKDTPADAVSPVDVDLQITHAFIGEGGVADVRLQPAEWKLVVDPDAPTDELELYVMARAGHRLAVPTEDLIADELPGDLVAADLQDAARQNLNPDGVQVSSGKFSAWTIDPALPMKVGAVRTYQPTGEQPNAARIDTFQGGSASLVIAVYTGTKRIDTLETTCDLPADVQYHRLATIPVFDGPTVDGEVKGRLIETRYDPMVPLDYTLDPDSEDGIHVIVATITPRNDTPSGSQRGTVTLRFGGESLVVPVELRVAPLSIKPQRHFGSLFGAGSYLTARPKGVADMAEDSISVATFHGIPGGEDGLLGEVATENSPEGLSIGVKELASRYFHALLDFHLLPRSPTLFNGFSYSVVERGEGLAPELTGWDFSHGYDQAMEEFVINRDMPWFAVYHTNGYQMHKLRLSNGTTYSTEENPDDPNWVQLSREQFDLLVGDYFDGLARHLDELGILDRAILVVDESGFETYDTIYAFVKAMRSRPFAKQIKIGHTSYKTSTWTRRLPDGKLLMDEVLDVPIPISDEHFNFFEPEWNSRFKKPGKIQWVYNVESDHLNLENAGLSTLFLPLRLQHLGIDGWYDWESFIWSLPYAYFPGERGGFKYGTGPVRNPWANPFYHHGPGVISFFYPPDPRGPAPEPTLLIVPAYRLSLMRDGIQERALLEVLQESRDDSGQTLSVDADRLSEAQAQLNRLWPDNPVQWYLSYQAYRESRRKLHDLAMDSGGR